MTSTGILKKNELVQVKGMFPVNNVGIGSYVTELRDKKGRTFQVPDDLVSRVSPEEAKQIEIEEMETEILRLRNKSNALKDELNGIGRRRVGTCEDSVWDTPFGIE